MKEFMLLIRNVGDAKAGLSHQKHEDFLQACRTYIGQLTSAGKLISAQPLVREGKMISGAPGSWSESPYSNSDEIIVGYYHILADDIDDAVAIAKGNPEFAYSDKAKIEVRPIKMKEETTGYIYPKG